MEMQSASAGAAAAFGLPFGDAFHIDDLLDFSNEDIAGPIGEGLLTSADEPGSNAPLAGTKHCLDAEQHSAGALCVPSDDLSELDWLSQLVEDSFFTGETPAISRPVTNSSAFTDLHFETSYSSLDSFRTASPVSVLESSSSASPGRGGNQCRELSVPGRARSKRARTGGSVWGNSRILSSSSCSLTDSEPLSSDSNGISCGHDSSPSVGSHQHPMILMTPPKAVTTSKKPWKPAKGGKKGQEAAQPWRCLHCATQRTPQWRAGPMGPKTLCNACGVRYKSGRLLPEYRPAGSPGYIGDKHSNSHKKILEMRRQKETTTQLQHSLLSSPATSAQVALVSAHARVQQHLEEDDPCGICPSYDQNRSLDAPS